MIELGVGDAWTGDDDHGTKGESRGETRAARGDPRAAGAFARRTPSCAYASADGPEGSRSTARGNSGGAASWLTMGIRGLPVKSGAHGWHRRRQRAPRRRAEGHVRLVVLVPAQRIHQHRPPHEAGPALQRVRGIDRMVHDPVVAARVADDRVMTGAFQSLLGMMIALLIDPFAVPMRTKGPTPASSTRSSSPPSRRRPSAAA